MIDRFHRFHRDRHGFLVVVIVMVLIVVFVVVVFVVIIVVVVVFVVVVNKASAEADGVQIWCQDHRKSALKSALRPLRAGRIGPGK